jgi:outer membrane lipoprotein-sorting protein
MRIQTWQAVVFRAALAVLAMAAIAACGAKQGATDAERLARGRDLVKQMSSTLASATGVSVTTMEQRDMVRGAKKETVSLKGSYTLRGPDRFFT